MANSINKPKFLKKKQKQRNFCKVAMQQRQSLEIKKISPKKGNKFKKVNYFKTFQYFNFCYALVKV